MKGNQEPMLYTTNATVAALNHVPGFDPLKFLRRTISRKTGEDVMRLDLRYKKLWFRLACPTGRLKLNALRITEKMAIFEAKVYRDREDAEPLSSYVANCTLDATPGGLYVEAAQEEALDTALSNAGFGIQFADVGSESEEYGSEVPVGAKVEIAKPVQVKTADAKPVQTKVEVAEPVQKQPETVKTAPQGLSRLTRWMPSWQTICPFPNRSRQKLWKSPRLLCGNPYSLRRPRQSSRRMSLCWSRNLPPLHILKAALWRRSAGR